MSSAYGFVRRLEVVESEHPVLPPEPVRSAPEATVPTGPGTGDDRLARCRRTGWGLFLLTAGSITGLIVIAVLLGVARVLVPWALSL